MSSVISDYILPRERVTATFAAAIDACPLMVLTAPMGYGKTTAAKAFMAACDKESYFVTVPLSLQNGHTAQYLWEMIHAQFAAQGLSIAAELGQLGFPENAFMMDRIINIFRAYSEPVLIVIDDYHNSRCPSFDIFLESLIRMQLANLSLFILSRECPEMHLDELKLKKLAIHHDHSLLVFSQAETQEFFNLYQNADDAIAERIWSLSEGWAAAIFISLQSWLSQGYIAPAQDMEALLEQTFIPSYNPDEQRLLLSLSILDDFTAAQATYIMADADTPAKLRKLSAKNALISYLPATGRYQLHSIFRTFLASHFDALSEELDKPALYRRAAEWCAQQNEQVRAIHFFAKAGEDADLVRILEIFAQPCEVSGVSLISLDPKGIPPIMDSIGWHIRKQEPIGWLIYVFCCFFVDPEKAKSLLESFAQWLDGAGFPPDIRQHLEGELEMVYGGLAYNDMREIVRHHHIAAGLLAGPSRLNMPQRVWAIAPQLSYQYLREPGEYRELMEIMWDESCIRDLYKIEGRFFVGLQELSAALYWLEQGELDKVETDLIKGMFKSKSAAANPVHVIAGNMIMARLRIIQGRRADALALMADLHPFVEATYNPAMDSLLYQAEGYIGSVVGDAAIMEFWLKNGGDVAATSLRQEQTYAAIVYGGALRFFKRWAELEALSETLEADLGRYRNLLGYIHAYCMRAVAAYNLRGHDAALPHLRKAWTLAEPDGLVLPIAEYGGSLLPLVEALAAENACPPLLLNMTRTVAALSIQGKIALTAKQQAFMRMMSTKGLTGREQEVLELLISDCDTADIQQALGISEAAVRYHQTGLFRKLGQPSRRALLRFFYNWTFL